jgi:hypothetical protein
MAAATNGGQSAPKPSTEQGTGSDGRRSANDDRSDSLNDNNDAKKASDANQAEQAKRGS